MSDEAARLKQDLHTIEQALGLDIWTRRDVRRGFLGDLAGGAAGLFLALWNFRGGQPEAARTAVALLDRLRFPLHPPRIQTNRRHA